ncbi:hypothetical protein C8R43DRAFT_1173733 [Mycena crocata]|nr:hypothetical protein C8R43DRAFT_1173733 [Mycena crocata]
MVLDDAGKTKLLFRLKDRKIAASVLPATIPAIGDNIEIIRFRRHSVTLWDFGGMDKIRPLWRRCFIFSERLCDGTDADYPVLVLANKIDAAKRVDLAVPAQILDINALVVSGRTIAVKVVVNVSHEHIAQIDQGKKVMEASMRDSEFKAIYQEDIERELGGHFLSDAA